MEIRLGSNSPTSVEPGFASKLRRMVIWGSQAATHLRHLAIFKSLEAKPVEP
jgi:hypothetical protein